MLPVRPIGVAHSGLRELAKENFNRRATWIIATEADTMAHVPAVMPEEELPIPATCDFSRASVPLVLLTRKVMPPLLAPEPMMTDELVKFVILTTAQKE